MQQTDLFVFVLLQKSERQAQATTTYPPRLSTNNLHEMANPMYALNADQQPVDAFTRFDVIETSMHFNIKRLDLHIIVEASGAGTLKVIDKSYSSHL